MIAQPSVRRVFEYVFRPCMDNFRDHQNDDGFSVCILSDGCLHVTRFMRNGNQTEEVFRLNPQFLYDYSQLLSCNNWLFDLPHDYLTPTGYHPRFWSELYLDGLMPFRIEDFPKLTHLPCGDRTGRPARKLMVFFEDIMDLTQRYGISLDIHTLRINYGMLTPMTDTRMKDNWMNTVS